MQKRNIYILVIVGALVWTALHIPGITYGTSDTPLHVSYMSADEQSPINGALHMLESKSLLGLRNVHTLYYGPIFAMIGLPAIGADFIIHRMSGAVSGALGYKEFVVWNWGGILLCARIISVLFAYLGLMAIFLLFRTRKFNPSQNAWIPFVAVILLGFNYLFFEYSHFFRHWIFIVAILFWQIYALVRIVEQTERRRAYWIIHVVLTVISFGISYLGIIYQIIWLPVLIQWLREKKWMQLKEWIGSTILVLVGCLLIVAWHPYGFSRLLGMVGLITPPVLSQGSVLDLTSVSSGSNSFVFYAEIILRNNVWLCIAGLLLLIVGIRMCKIHTRYWTWSILLAAVANYIVFSIPFHHESRYMLPSVVLIVIATLGLFSVMYSELGNRRAVIRISGILICISLLWSLVQFVGWQRMIASGPAERRELVPQVMAWQAQNPAAKILIVKNWPIGYVHTHEAYADYIKRYEKESTNLWQYILALKAPAGLVPLNAYYKHSIEPLTEQDRRMYDHVVITHDPKTDADVIDISPQDQFDLHPWTVWDYARYQETYEIIK